MIYGNTEGIRDIILNRLEEIYEADVPKDSFFTIELAETISDVTKTIQREISVAIDRKGRVISVAIGDSTMVEVPVIDIKEKKLSGVRVIHTHPNGVSRLSALDMSALIKLKLDCIAAIGVDENGYRDVTLGFCGIENDLLIGETVGPITLDRALEYDILDRIKHMEGLIKSNNLEEDESEAAILVGVESEESLIELKELAKACDVLVIDIVLQKRSRLDSAYYVGRGKVEEIAMLCQAHRANLVIFDDELSGSQVRNLEEALGVKVIDRTTLILDIFARRARTREAKIQVELAQLKYRIPRLTGLGTVLSRTGGGIGTRGPGEKKLETDRRHIKERVYDLTNELERVRKTRETQREKRSSVQNVSLVGYTNAGKSTLRNKLCEIAMPKDAVVKENVFEADMLFATLDITTRAIVLPDNRLVALTDTVGFIKKLPHDLVEAFKSTLEEVVYSDILVHVIDASNVSAISQIQAVNDVLSELGVKDKPIILALNKIDKAPAENIEAIREKVSEGNIIEISARENINLDLLLNNIAQSLPTTLRSVNYLIPYSEQSVAAFLHRNSKIEKEEFNEEGTVITAQVDDEVFNKCEKYMI